ncbi:helix-turn-helix domain-containing protein [Nocardioides sp. L-11A]|uniref:helix-turn-helix domain-containing protein n=1 Tax=Nocardioides sp. L-11A TaxID=3043848 RepID=UPI00249B0852|nr:helix-turn-helix domain-containing protein [Nocardioides sp. L-11A]
MTESVSQSSPQRIEVRRNVALSASVGGFSALLTVAFAVRAFTGGTTLDWVTFGVLALVTLAHLAALVDGRAPLLVADEHGVRLRQGATWRGIAWPEIDCLEHLPRRGLVRDGHLLVDGYDDQQLVVPLTLATRLVGAEPGSLSDVLAELADGRADVVEVVPDLADDVPERSASVPKLSDLYADEAPDAPEERRGIAARVAAGLTGRREPDEPASDASDASDLEDTGEVVLAADTESTDEFAAVEDHGDEQDEPPAPERPTVLPARVELDRPTLVRAPIVETPIVETPIVETPRPVADDTGSVTVVLDDLAVRPAAQPVIGPELTAARDRLRLTIDQLSERTRIRPHVIEAIEVDDFAPCGGDFYARGHLRTLARVLGIDAGPLVASYDETYADAPVDPRRVFESELATGAGGAIRSTRGGRNWSVLIAAVMGAVLVWSVAKLVMGGPAPVGDTPVLNQSGGISQAAAAKGDPVKLTLTAAGGGAQLVIRDAAGEIVFDGNLAFGQTSELKVVPPVRIWASDGSVTYAIGGRQPQALGETGAEVSKTLVAP